MRTYFSILLYDKGILRWHGEHENLVLKHLDDAEWFTQGKFSDSKKCETEKEERIDKLGIVHFLLLY